MGFYSDNYEDYSSSESESAQRRRDNRRVRLEWRARGREEAMGRNKAAGKGVRTPRPPLASAAAAREGSASPKPRSYAAVASDALREAVGQADAPAPSRSQSRKTPPEADVPPGNSGSGGRAQGYAPDKPNSTPERSYDSMGPTRSPGSPDRHRSGGSSSSSTTSSGSSSRSSSRSRAWKSRRPRSRRNEPRASVSTLVAAVIAALGPTLQSMVDQAVQRAVGRRADEPAAPPPPARPVAAKPAHWDEKTSISDHLDGLQRYFRVVGLLENKWVATALTFHGERTANYLVRTAEVAKLTLYDMDWDTYRAFVIRHTVAQDPQTTVRTRLRALRPKRTKLADYAQQFRTICSDAHSDLYTVKGVEACEIISAHLRDHIPELHSAVLFDMSTGAAAPWTDESLYLQQCVLVDAQLPYKQQAPAPKARADKPPPKDRKKPKNKKRAHDEARTRGERQPLSDAERARLKARGICTYCRDESNPHEVAKCPKIRPQDNYVLHPHKRPKPKS